MGGESVAEKKQAKELKKKIERRVGREEMKFLKFSSSCVLLLLFYPPPPKRIDQSLIQRLNDV